MGQFVVRFVHVVALNVGGYFRTERQVLVVCGSCLVSLSSSMLNLLATWEWSGYRGVFEYWVFWGSSHYFHTKVCSHMISGGDLCHVGTSKLIWETNL